LRRNQDGRSGEFRRRADKPCFLWADQRWARTTSVWKPVLGTCHEESCYHQRSP
jgi:hypothetical protein